jgi:hypothetical protein
MSRLLRDPTPDPRFTPRSGITGQHWWIVEVEEVGRTAIPGRKLAHQAKEVCRGVGLKVLRIRPAVVTDPGDLVAIEQSRAELKDAQLAIAVAAGVIPGARTHGQTPKIATAP